MPTDDKTGNQPQQQRKKRLTDSKRFYVIASFFIYVLAGFAVWWFSTGAYQSLFPHEDIQQLLEKNASHSLLPSIIINVHYINFKSSSVGQNLSSKKFIGSLNHWNIEQLNNIRDDHQKIDGILRDWIQAKKLDKPNHYHLFIISGQEEKEVTLNLGTHRHAWTLLGSDNGVSSSIFELYFNVLTNSNTSPSKSNPIKNTYDDFGDLSSEIVDDSDITVSKTAMKYRITFNVVNMSPFRNYLFDWGSETTNFENYIRSFTDSISNLADFLIEWKTVMYGNLPVNGLHSKSADVSKLRKYKTFQNFERRNPNDIETNTTAIVTERQEPYFEIDARSMQFLLNENNDWKFVSQDANETSIQFLVLIPPKESSPLLLRKYDGSVSQHNSYIVPRWGGVLVFNPSKHIYKNTGLKTLDSVDVQYIMEIFTNQLRRLLSIPPPTPTTVKIDSKGVSKVKVQYISSLESGASQWEIDQLYRHRIQNNLLRAVETLKSMSRVVNNMPNVYVWDIVADLTRESIENIHQALSLINNNQVEKLEELLAKSKTAIYSAERAFGHESMLSMLHFPDSQKLAIYLPLVLPILITILVGFKREKNVLADKLKTPTTAQ